LKAETVAINGKPVVIEWTSAAQRALEQRSMPLIVELEIYFSCLVKKFVHFREDSRGKPTVSAHDKLQLYFRMVTSTACAIDVAECLGRQPETEVEGRVSTRIAPKRVYIDHVKGEWRGSFDL